jgi:hypothetical protein
MISSSYFPKNQHPEITASAATAEAKHVPTAYSEATRTYPLAGPFPDPLAIRLRVVGEARPQVLIYQHEFSPPNPVTARLLEKDIDLAAMRADPLGVRIAALRMISCGLETYGWP